MADSTVSKAWSLNEPPEDARLVASRNQGSANRVAPTSPRKSEISSSSINDDPSRPLLTKQKSKSELSKKTSTGEVVSSSDDHYKTLDEIARRHPDSNIDPINPKNSRGLSQVEAERRLLAFGPNALKPPKKTPKIILFLKQLLDPFLILLEIAAALSFGTYSYSKINTDLYAAVALVIVTILTALFAYVQENKASGILAKFSKLLTAKCVVFRDGHEQEMNDAANLVVGDIVKIKGGDKVPADLRILYSQGMKVDNGPLTGESRPISLTSNPSPANTVPTEALCLAWKASACAEGEAIGVVVRTGDKTFIGGIASLTSNSKAIKTTLQVEVERFVLFIAKLAIGMGIVCFAVVIGRQKGHNILKNIIAGFLIPIIANVPEGLPATVNSLLAITASRMAKRNVLVKKLDCVETLGCTTLICSDKTGTLTKNQMTVTECWVDQQVHAGDFASLFATRQHRQHRSHATADSASGRLRTQSTGSDISRASSTNEHEKSIEAMSTTGAQYVSSFELFHRLGTVCNKAFIAPPKPGEAAEYVGNASDVAILRFCNDLRSSSTLRQHYPADFEIPFNSTTKWMLTIVHDVSAEVRDNMRKYTVLMKGAPEVILDRCSTFIRYGVERDIDDRFTDEFDEAYERFGNKGSRVIGVAQRTFYAPVDAEFSLETDNFPQDNLCFVGLYSITDPPRDGVKDAIAKCHSAGIKVFMVTGDHHLTAKAIAKQIGILNEAADEATDPYAVILGVNVDSLTAQDWAEISKRDGVVFARTTPVHKLKIVQSNQAQGHIVAVTGDGVNDAPALKNANIGIAMGISGSEVAREAAAIVLLDDNFASIVLGIEQGRVIFDNLKKTIAYTLTHLPPEMYVFVLNLFLNFPAPLSSLQILSIDLATELAPAISLAYEGPESDIMKRKPRDVKKNRLVSRSLLMYAYLLIGTFESVAAAFAYFWVFANRGIWPKALYNTATNNWQSTGNDPFCYGPFTNSTTGPPEQKCLDSDQQATLAFQAASAYYLTTTLSQGFHAYMCKTSRISVFAHKWDNSLMYFGTVIQVALAVLFVYVPGVQVALNSADPGYPGWASLGAAGIVIIIFNEWRKWHIRSYPTTWLTKELLW